MWYPYEPWWYYYYEPAYWKNTRCLQEFPEVFACLAKKVDYKCCPHIKFCAFEDPCPRKDRELKHSYPIELLDINEQTTILAFHYWFKELIMDTLYDVFPAYKDYRVFSLESTWNKGPYIRFHTCKQARRLFNIKVEAYGLGWAYITWNTPKENCLSKYYYDYDFRTDGFVGSRREVGQFYSKYRWYEHNKVFTCPRYPLKFCVFLSDHIVPYKTFKFTVRNARLEPDEEDISPWRSIYFTTDDKGKGWKHCTPKRFYESLWFAILLGLLLALLLGLIAFLALYLRKLKKDQLLGRKGGKRNNSSLSKLGQLWERLRNFFNELCPRPSKPAPPPKPKPKPKKPKKKKKPKSKKSKSKKPEPDKYITGRREKLAAVAPPKTRVRSPKGIRDMKQEKAPPPETAYLESKKAESAVGGGASRRRRR